MLKAETLRTLCKNLSPSGEVARRSRDGEGFIRKEDNTMRSDNVTKGSERAPNRSLFYALGYTPEELERPLIGVVSAYSEIVPGHM